MSGLIIARKKQQHSVTLYRPQFESRKNRKQAHADKRFMLEFPLMLVQSKTGLLEIFSLSK